MQQGFRLPGQNTKELPSVRLAPAGPDLIWSERNDANPL